MRRGRPYGDGGTEYFFGAIIITEGGVDNLIISRHTITAVNVAPTINESFKYSLGESVRVMVIQPTAAD